MLDMCIKVESFAIAEPSPQALNIEYANVFNANKEALAKTSFAPLMVYVLPQQQLSSCVPRLVSDAELKAIAEIVR